MSTLASILPGECTGARINYYEKIEELIQTNEEYCRFDGEEFDAISFSDHVTTPQKRAIDSLLKACVVK